MQQQTNLKICDKISQLVNRPKRSEQVNKICKPVKVLSNHFPFEFKDKSAGLNIYAVSFSEDVPQDSREVISQLINLSKDQFRKAGLEKFSIRGLNIWSPQYVQERIISEVTLDGKKHCVYLNFTKAIDFQYLEGENQDPALMQPLQQAINVQVKKALKDMGLRELNRLSQFFDPKSVDANPVRGFPLKVWLGFKTSLKLSQTKPQLLIDYASRVLSTETALSFIRSFNQNIGEIKDQVEGKSVLATYGNYRLYKISAVDFKKNPNSTFQLDDGKQITYAQYYQERYKIKINDMKQPLLESLDKRNPDKKFYLIPELVYMTGLRDDQKSDFGLMKELAFYTKKEPGERLQIIQSLLGKLQKQLGAQQMVLKSDSTTAAYICQQPQLMFGNQRKLDPDPTGFFILKDPVYQSSYIKDWFLIYQSRGRQDDDLADDLVADLTQQGGRLGIKFDKPFFINMKGNKPQDWVKELQAEFKNGLPSLVVSITDKNRDTSLYIALKDFLLSQGGAGVIHQNVTTKACKNKNKQSIASKIAQQISVKLGNPLWVIPKVKGISDKIMIIGMDIYHKLVSGKQSCMGFVAHFDLECKTSFSKSIIMRAGQEFNQAVGQAFKEALQAYFIHYNKKQLPDTILVYRDGVGESQIQALIQTELEQIKKVISTYTAGYNPQFAFITINKKISDRFFMSIDDAPPQARKNTKSPYINPVSGLVVADRITSKYFDFFLAAQYVTQGTCTPTHYTVLDNNTQFTEEMFWQITYFQCFNYWNWTGAVKVPACVQYAHKLAFLVGDTFQKAVHQNLQKQHFYL
ncbi:unnamed protein product [Paramecium pentaurelia]|uniref:Uncharacterized protein n=1 Tax=Paramecium pentaurelia TaxID=43138 RepID=A0A8S1V098_9CILI|nr:unnamed protein product [Paramecium pentaurelia]